MAGQEKLREIITRSARDVAAELGHLEHAAAEPGQVTEGYVNEHAQHAHQAIDRAAEAARVLVKESE